MKTKEIKSLRITLELIDNNTFKVVKLETPEKSEETLSKRQLNFKKADTKELLRKFDDVRFASYKKEIFEILHKRYSDTLFRPTDRNKKNLDLLKPFFARLFDELMKSTEINKVA